MRKLLELLRKLSNNLVIKTISYRFDLTLFINLFVRSLGLIYFISILSILYQFSDMYGAFQIDAIASEKFSGIIDYYKIHIFHFFSRETLYYFLWLSLGFSIFIILGFLPFWLLILNAIIYSSLIIQSSAFMRFQWDILLVEVTLLSLFFISPKLKKLSFRMIYNGYFLQLVPLLLLIIRLFIQSALVKGPPYWFFYNALNYHFYSQPFPHVISFYVHQLMIDFNLSKVSVFFVFLIEFAVPFGLLFRSYRQISAAIIIIFQLMIILTGNFGFFNFLVIAIVLPFLFIRDIKSTSRLILNQRNIIPFIGLLIIVFFSVSILVVKKRHFTQLFRPYFLMNHYGLFAKMTTNQTRYTIHLSNDGNTWVQLNLKYFDENGFPELPFVQPYHPRIRWQLWFHFFNFDFSPLWYQKFLKRIADSPNSIRSMVRIDQNLESNYQFVKTCYQQIVFDIDNGSNFWIPILDTSCYMFDTNNGRRFKI